MGIPVIFHKALLVNEPEIAIQQTKEFYIFIVRWWLIDFIVGWCRKDPAIKPLNSVTITYPYKPIPILGQVGNLALQQSFINIVADII